MGEKRASQICRERQIDVTTLRRWRIEHDERGAAAWHKPNPMEATSEQRIAELERVIGQLTVENMVLKKALARAQTRASSPTPSLAS